MNPLILEAIGPDGCELEHFRNQPLKAVTKCLSRHDYVDMNVRYGGEDEPFECRVVVHPNLRQDDTPRYLVTNLERETFNAEHISDAYRLRWQIELLFKEWKSHANLRAFDTSNPHIAEGLIWASLCAATLKRYCAHMTERIARVAISTHIVAKCVHHVLSDVLHALVHEPTQLHASMIRTFVYLSKNARRPHPKRDCKSGRLKLGLEHVYGAA